MIDVAIGVYVGVTASTLTFWFVRLIARYYALRARLASGGNELANLERLFAEQRAQKDKAR